MIGCSLVLIFFALAGIGLDSNMANQNGVQVRRLNASAELGAGSISKVSNKTSKVSTSSAENSAGSITKLRNGTSISSGSNMSKKKRTRKVSQICVHNAAGRILLWFISLRGDSWYSGYYSAGRTRCITGATAFAKHNDLLKCQYFDGGRKRCKGRGYRYSSKSRLQGNYRCSGPIRKVSCWQTGTSVIN